MSKFNEDSRVKIPALLHLTRLGYTYLSLKNAHWDERNNIFPELFEDAVLRINPELRREDVPALLDELHLKLKGDDIGRSFHQRLTARAGVRLIDFDNLGNNMEYDDGQFEPVQGAFYATSTYGEAHFNYFREERAAELVAAIAELDETIEDFVLTDTNLVAIKGTPEFERNKATDTPTHRLLTSLFSRQRFAFLLRYAFAWLNTEHGIEKHVMRYPQWFATQAIADRLGAGVRKGIVWHTQGSGKTALAYYNVRFLADWFQQRGEVARFYFIVDRLDLLRQARDEFRLRGLSVNVIESREAF